MNIVSRSQWGAVAPKYRYTMPLPSPRLWLHHTAVEQHGISGMQATQRFHMDVRGWSDIAYSFLVDDDGTAYEGRGAGVVGAHTAGDNSQSHAICAMGDYDVRKPPSALLLGLANLVEYGHSQGWWPEHFTGGHRQAPGASTACPGRYLMDALPGLNAAHSLPYVGDLLMPIAKDDNDARCTLIRTWFHDYLGRGPSSVAERDLHLLNFATNGADACLAGITDSPEAAAYQASR